MLLLALRGVGVDIAATLLIEAGDRQGNHALWRIVVVRMVSDPQRHRA